MRCWRTKTTSGLTDSRRPMVQAPAQPDHDVLGPVVARRMDSPVFGARAGSSVGAVPGWAECIRLAVWFMLHAAGEAQRVRRVPRLLTHRRADTQAAPSGYAGAGDQYVPRPPRGASDGDAGVPAAAALVRRRADDSQGNLIVPTRLRGNVQLRCLLDVLAHTTYRNFEMLIVVTQDAPLDQAQRQAAERLRAAGPVRIELLHRASFNYSLANNFGASRTDGAFICLLNDDVSTLDGDWLDRMVAVFSDKNVGIVGAKLYYPNMTTQHGGVIMGLGWAGRPRQSLPATGRARLHVAR